MRLWNTYTLPKEIQNNLSLRNKKKYLNRNNIKIPDYYNFRSRIGQISLKYGTLKLYSFRRNLYPSPFCTCGSIKCNNHYLAYCQNSNEIRSFTISKLPEPTNVNLMYFFLGAPIDKSSFVKKKFHQEQTILRYL